MVADWILICAGKLTLWRISVSALTELTDLRDAAEDALKAALTETTRTPAKRQNLLAWSLAA
jgi:hypothetical protein